VDITLFSAFCGSGIGSHFLQNLITEAADSNRLLSAHVEHANPARNLYRRLGFDEVEERGAYIFVVKNSVVGSQAIKPTILQN
jgi:ribosomal protein S18 acetylase RimI-like enzyme